VAASGADQKRLFICVDWMPFNMVVTQEPSAIDDFTNSCPSISLDDPLEIAKSTYRQPHGPDVAGFVVNLLSFRASHGMYSLPLRVEPDARNPLSTILPYCLVDMCGFARTRLGNK
jgi:hypothetical protein